MEALTIHRPIPQVSIITAQPIYIPGQSGTILSISETKMCGHFLDNHELGLVICYALIHPIRRLGI